MCTIAQWTEKYFLKIFLWLNVVLERDSSGRLSRHGSADGCHARPALKHTCRRAGLSSSLPAGSATPQSEQRLPFKPAPKTAGSHGVRELLFSPPANFFLSFFFFFFLSLWLPSGSKAMISRVTLPGSLWLALAQHCPISVIFASS